MCWNEHVSLNTYVFGIFVLGLIAYNNAYTKYKVDSFSNPFMYLFFFLFISVQLVEYFIWRNFHGANNARTNELLSILGSLVIALEPVAAIGLIPDKPTKHVFWAIYSTVAFLYFMYQLFTKRFYSSVAKNGHLRWEWVITSERTQTSILSTLFFAFFLIYPFYLAKKYYIAAFGFIIFAYSYYTYRTEQTFASMWCWFANFGMLYYVIYILFYLPYAEHGIC